MPTPLNKDLLKTLTRKEARVFYWKCYGLIYKEIGKKLSYGEDRITQIMGNIYEKLRINEEGLSKSDRAKLLYETYWNEFKEIIKGDYRNIDIWPLTGEKIKEEIQEVTGETAEEIKEEPSEEEEIPEPSPDPKILALVLSDEKQLTRVPNQPTQIIEIKKEDKRPPFIVRLIRWVLFFLAGLIILSLVAYFAFTSGRGLGPPQKVVITATLPEVIDTPLPSATVEIVSTNTSEPTLAPTDVPTDTPMPSATATVFVPPADGILFRDTFDQTIGSEWTIYGGNWFVSDGRLTRLAEEGTYSYEWIALNKSEWKNYIVSVDITKANYDDITIGVRNNTTKSELIGVWIDSYDHLNLALLSNEYTDNSYIGGKSDVFVSRNFNLQMEVQGDTYILRLDGREIQRITISGYHSGGISLGIHCTNEIQGCSEFDNFEVTYLP